MQAPTKVSANAFGGKPELLGHFVFADRRQVESATLWEDNSLAKNVGIVVNCTSGKRPFR